tara:strand:- start:73 stop:675 length:603 start_codon:yes stop_codon:yes gene_type:complete
MRGTVTREFYIPAGSVEVSQEGVGAVAYYYDSYTGDPAEQPRSAAMIFIGKQQKPAKRHSFKSVERREEYVQSIFGNVRDVAEYKKRKAVTAKAAKAKAASAVKVGDIFDTSWGYDQTNVEFYQVVAKRGQVIEVIEIGQVAVESKPDGCDYVAPNPERKIGEVMTRRINQYGGFKAHDCCNASPYEGNPKYQTALGFGH